jgi:glycosyltransferase involved in cell wall biosynthesis
MSKLRVAIVAPSLRILGGQAVHSQRLIDGWAKDPEVQAWLVPIDPELPRAFAHAHRIKYIRTAATQLTYWPQLTIALRHADVVHVSSAASTSFLVASLPAIIVARALGKPVILNYHSGAGPRHLRASAIARTAARRVDRVVVPSQFLVSAFGAFGIRAFAIPNHVDAERFPYRKRERLQPRILSVRNLEQRYNVACTLRAFQLVQRHYPDAQLTVVGSGSLERALRDEARALGLTRVVFAGRVEPEEMPSYFAAHDIYVQTSDIDNMPLSILEAYASGLPVVATAAGGVPVMLTHGEHGLLAPLDDHRTVASHVISLLERPELATAVADNALKRAQSHQWEDVRGAWLAHYRDVAEARAVRPAGLRVGLEPK